jgi:hypothetical protein
MKAGIIENINENLTMKSRLLIGKNLEKVIVLMSFNLQD